jgi:hypothetical protein
MVEPAPPASVVTPSPDAKPVRVAGLVTADAAGLKWSPGRTIGCSDSSSGLELPIAGSELEPRLSELQAEIAQRGLLFRPHFWLSNEWFTPDGIPGIAIPFYLAHPRLARLELHQMFEIEGGTHEWCMQILRHETGHAIENAFKLRSRRRRHELFGSTREEYPEFYAPRPYSKSFVIHLDAWYAQSHPDEDFAETFAVWLHPESKWRERYRGGRRCASSSTWTSSWAAWRGARRSSDRPPR